MANSIQGKVVEIGAQGSLITDIPLRLLSEVPHDETTIIKFGDHQTMGIFAKEHGQPESTLVAMIGETGCLEIEIVGISLSEMLKINIDQQVSVHW